MVAPDPKNLKRIKDMTKWKVKGKPNREMFEPENELVLLNNENILCPKLYSFDEVRKLLKQTRLEVWERINDLPRIEITHKDGSKTKAVLEHSLELVKSL